MNIKNFLIVIIIVGILTAACNAGVTSSQLSSRAIDETVEIQSGNTATERPISTTLPSPISTSPSLPSPEVSLVHTPTPLVPPTGSPTLLPSPTPPHPLTIEYLRQGDYPASEIVIVENLKPGLNYNRYIASYLSEGLKIYALLTVPFGEKPANGWPVIIFNHGYIPPNQYRTTEKYMDHVDDLAMHGYIVFRSDYRGHANSEGEARGAYGHPDYTIDILNAVAAIKQYPDADPNRIGMWGHSMGGYITLRAMVASADIKAGVIWAGVVASYPDLLTRWRRPSSVATPTISQRARRWRSSLIDEYGSPEENPEFWGSISANLFLEDLSGPVQLHHGTDDESVPLEFSTILAKQIQDAGGTVEYYKYRGDNHNISNKFGDAMFRSLQFFERYVKGLPSRHTP